MTYHKEPPHTGQASSTPVQVASGINRPNASVVSALDDEGYGFGGDVDDDQLEDMFRGVLGDENERDQYFPSNSRSRICFPTKPIFLSTCLMMSFPLAISPHELVCDTNNIRI